MIGKAVFRNADLLTRIEEITAASGQAEHERGIILHEAAAKALKAAQIGGKLPSVLALQAEHRQHFTGRKAAGAGKGNRARIRS